MNTPNLHETVAQMKAEILGYIAQGRIPATVSSFSELHDYIDANTLGGFCDAGSVMDIIIELQDERDSLDEEALRNWPKAGELEELQEQSTAFANAAQNAVDAWIKSGALKGADVIQQTIFKLSAIQKTQPPTSKVWQDISKELEPLFERMRSIVARPVPDFSGLRPDLAKAATYRAAQMWCYVNADGAAFYVTEDKARKMQARSGGTVYPPCPPLIKFEVVYRNFAGDPRKVLYVEALNSKDAEALALRHIREHGAQIDGHISSVTEAAKLPVGKVL